MAEVQTLPFQPASVPQETIHVPPADPESARVQPPHIDIFSSNDPVFGSDVRNAAQLLHTRVYLREGHITESDVNPMGYYHDAYVPRSTYYFVRNTTKVASARLIHASKIDGMLSLPTARYFASDPEAIREAAGVRRLTDIKHDEAVEVSALASERFDGGKSDGDFDAVISLYSTMIRDSLEQGHKLWLLNTEPTFIRRLSILVGQSQVHQLGEAQTYMGAPTVPAAINPQEVVRTVLRNEDDKYALQKLHLVELLRGVDARRVPKDIRELMTESGIEFRSPNWLKSRFSTKEMIGHAAVMAYSMSRAIPAGNLDQFHGDTAVLWGVDVATSLPYSMGLAKMYGGKSTKEKLAGAAMAIPSFLAPYAYLYANGEGYPGYVNGIVAAFIGSAVGKEAFGRRRVGQRERALDAGLRATTLPTGKQAALSEAA